MDQQSNFQADNFKVVMNFRARLKSVDDEDVEDFVSNNSSQEVVQNASSIFSNSISSEGDFEGNISSDNGSSSSEEPDVFDEEMPRRNIGNHSKVSRAKLDSVPSSLKYELVPRRQFALVPTSEQRMTPNQHERSLLFDSHCHLDRIFSQAFQKPIADFFNSGPQQPLEILKEKYSKEAFIECINVITNVKYFNHKYWSSFFDYPKIWLAIGCHPSECKDYDEQAEYELTISLEHPKVVALGEIGLDDKWDKFGMPYAIQKKVRC